MFIIFCAVLLLGLDVSVYGQEIHRGPQAHHKQKSPTKTQRASHGHKMMGPKFSWKDPTIQISQPLSLMGQQMGRIHTLNTTAQITRQAIHLRYSMVHDEIFHIDNHVPTEG